MTKRKTQADAVVEVLVTNGGYAKLNYLYRNTLEIPGVEWKTLTPDASIRRIVQNDQRILKIKPGLYVLKEHIKDLPIDIYMLIENKLANKSNLIEDTYSHSYYQGLIAEIGILQKYNTYITPQDRGKKFVDKNLDELSLMKNLPEFTYTELVNSAKFIDVIYFNDRNFPQKVYEIEHTTSFDNSLLRFKKFSDFSMEMYIVADKSRKDLFQKKIDNPAYYDIKDRVKFIDYDRVGKIYEALVVLNEINAYSFIR